MCNAELTLGAAQLGMKYGVANIKGSFSEDDAIKFLVSAVNQGLRSIDTSPAYGKSEVFTGAFSAQRASTPLAIMTKLPSLCLDEGCSYDDIIDNVSKFLNRSLEKLCVQNVDSYLVHSEKDFLVHGERLVKALKVFSENEGKVNNIGVSVYSPKAALRAIEMGVDCLQLPCNIFDHRFDRAGVYQKADQYGVKMYARSIYLQGLFFLDPVKVANWNPGAVTPLQKLNELSRRYERPVAEIAMVYARDHVAVTNLVVGMETISQVTDNIHLMNAPS